jgi:hypothetical protein
MADLTLTLKAAAIKAACKEVFGFEPNMYAGPSGDYIQIVFSEEQYGILQKWIEEQLKKDPRDIRIDLSPVLIPLIVKKAMPYLMATAAVGFTIGRKL